MPKLTGDKELMQTLRSLRMAPTKILDDACRSSLEPLRARTADNAKVLRQPHSPRGGHLDEGVITAKVDGRGPYYRVFWVSFTRRARKLAHLVEFGTAPHWQPNFRGGFMHPGARPKPFFRPAFEQTKEEVADSFGRQMWAGLVSSIRGVRR